MWDRPDILNRLASSLYGVAAALALYAVAAALAHLPLFPLREVRVVSAPVHVTPEQVEAIVKSELRGNFFTVDLAAARAAFERVPWVRRAQVRRLWPDRLDVALEEHVPFARWGSRALVNTHGEIFEGSHDGRLPVFAGPESAAKEIAIQYEYFRRSLASIGLEPAEVRVSQRRAWQVRLASGLTLELGREHIEARLTRFVASYERTLAKLGRPLEYVDLRYSNGFAVRIPELRFEKPERRGRGAA
jgi:cell division protein FtsQ